MAAGEAAVGLSGIDSIRFPELALIRVIPAPFLSDGSGMGVAQRPSGEKANTHRPGGAEDWDEWGCSPEKPQLVLRLSMHCASPRSQDFSLIASTS